MAASVSGVRCGSGPARRGKRWASLTATAQGVNSGRVKIEAASPRMYRQYGRYLPPKLALAQLKTERTQSRPDPRAATVRDRRTGKARVVRGYGHGRSFHEFVRRDGSVGLIRRVINHGGKFNHRLHPRGKNGRFIRK